MSSIKIEKLTPEQIAQIPTYFEKWRAIALSTEPIDRQRAQEAIRAAYALVGKEEPSVIFCSNPYTAILKSLALNQAQVSLVGQLVQEIRESLDGLLWTLYDLLWTLDLEQEPELKKLLYLTQDQLEGTYCEPVEAHIWRPLRWHLWSQLQKELEARLSEEHYERPIKESEGEVFCGNFYQKLWENFYNSWIYPQFWSSEISIFDIYYSVFKFVPAHKQWKALQALAESCGWIYPFEKTCIVCDRPVKLKLSFDRENRLHAEGEPAIQFPDGYSFYPYHGIRLPGKYGALPPQQWQANWILEERNAELKRVLIQGIGYRRIAQELQAIELDTWQEYSLLQVDTEVNEPVTEVADDFDEIDNEFFYVARPEPAKNSIHLLKMTCPSTGFIHVMCVPPDIQSAREAIRWVNWGIDPEEFQMQT